jgi:hypothetical protein
MKSVFWVLIIMAMGAAVSSGGSQYRPPDNQTIAVAVRALENRVARLEARIRRLERGR